MTTWCALHDPSPCLVYKAYKSTLFCMCKNRVIIILNKSRLVLKTFQKFITIWPWKCTYKPCLDKIAKMWWFFFWNPKIDLALAGDVGFSFRCPQHMKIFHLETSGILMMQQPSLFAATRKNKNYIRYNEAKESFQNHAVRGRIGVTSKREKFDDVNLLWKMTKLTFLFFSLTNDTFI